MNKIEKFFSAHYKELVHLLLVLMLTSCSSKPGGAIISEETTNTDAPAAQQLITPEQPMGVYPTQSEKPEMLPTPTSIAYNPVEDIIIIDLEANQNIENLLNLDIRALAQNENFQKTVNEALRQKYGDAIIPDYSLLMMAPTLQLAINSGVTAPLTELMGTIEIAVKIAGSSVKIVIGSLVTTESILAALALILGTNPGIVQETVTGEEMSITHYLMNMSNANVNANSVQNATEGNGGNTQSEPPRNMPTPEMPNTNIILTKGQKYSVQELAGKFSTSDEEFMQFLRLNMQTRNRNAGVNIARLGRFGADGLRLGLAVNKNGQEYFVLYGAAQQSDLVSAVVILGNDPIPLPGDLWNIMSIHQVTGLPKTNFGSRNVPIPKVIDLSILLSKYRLTTEDIQNLMITIPEISLGE